MLVQVIGKAQFAIHTTNACLAAFDIDHVDLFLGRKELVHGEHVAHIRVARVSASLPCWVGDHFLHTLDSRFWCGGEFNVIVQTLAHFIFTVNAKHLSTLQCVSLAARPRPWSDNDS